MTDIVPTDDYAPPTGLEDIGPEDLAIPRLNIDHEKAKFIDSLSNEEFGSLETVVLGLCRQRVLWEPEIRENAKPLCRSRDGKIGLPQANFPWASTGFLQDGTDEQQELECAACPLQEWGSHPTREQVPWCTEQFIAVVYHEGGPALLALQRSGMKAVRAFANSFVRTQQPTFTKYTTISLTPQRTGMVRYAAPKFVVGEKTPLEDHDFFADMYVKARKFIQSRRVVDVASDDVAEAAVKPEGGKREPAPVDETVDPF